MDEAEVEHLVGLVQHQHMRVIKAQRLAFDHVDQTAGRRDNHISAARELLGLRIR